MINWQSLFQTLGGMAIAAAAVAWLARALISQWLSRDIERHKAKLAADASVELEKLRSELQRLTQEHATTFASLHLKRSDVVAELYRLLVTVEEAVAAFVDPRCEASDPETELHYYAANDSMGALLRIYNRHRLYFTPELCAGVETLLGALHAPVRDKALLGLPEFVTPERAHQIQTEEYREFRGRVQHVKALVEQRFRKLLGVAHDSGVSE